MHVPTLLVVTFLAMSRGEGARDGTVFYCWTTRPKTNIAVTTTLSSVCKSAIASATTDREDYVPKGRQLAVTSDSYTKLRWRISENGDRVFAVSIVNENRSNSTKCYLVNSTSLEIVKGKTKLIQCKYIHVLKDPKAQITLVPVNSSVDAVGGIMSNKLSSPPDRKTTTPTPVGCYNWRPNSIIGIPVNQTIKVTWSPAFKEGSLKVYLFDIEKHEQVDSHMFKSYEDVMEHTFQDVKYGSYEVRMKPTGCNDCEDRESQECHVDPVSSNPIVVTPTVTDDLQETTTMTPVSCYKWRPSVIPLTRVNQSIKVTWSPTLKDGSLEVYLFDRNEHKTVTIHTFKSYEIYNQDITEDTFQDVKYGNYEVRIKPICSDCPEKETKECHVDPFSSDPIQVFPPPTEGHIEYAVTRPVETTIRDNMVAFYFMVAVTAIAVISAVAMGVMCLRKDSLPCANRPGKNVKQSKPSVPFDVVYTQLSTAETGTKGGTPRIVILYGVDHDFHIQAVRAFARLLRKLLNAVVVVEREQSRHDLCNISDWLTTNLDPPTVVIVVASEGLYQLFSHHDGQQGECISKLQSDMFADYSSMALGYLREKNFATTRSQIVLPVSFGYQHGDDSLNKLMESCRLLFKGVYFKITETTVTGERHLYMDELLKCLARNQTIDVSNCMPEGKEFLHYVDAMNDHIGTFGSTCWKYDPSIRYDGSGASKRYSVIGDAFSVRSGVSGASNVTVNFTCKNCLTSSWLTLPQSAVSSVSERGIRSSRQSRMSESSCVSETLSESRDDVFYSESETGPETRHAVYESRMESSPLLEPSSVEPVLSEHTVIGGRDC
ncbi:uncharacterized protein [Haliotis asinina]|uniref:uncharacterized protein isoform X2 n=1 Tax=Haliotis asinina TaxID=109174 RepID=UPI003531DABC